MNTTGSVDKHKNYNRTEQHIRIELHGECVGQRVSHISVHFVFSSFIWKRGRRNMDHGTERYGDRIEGFEIWIWRKSGRLECVVRVCNEGVLTGVETNRTLFNTVLTMKRNWMGHFLRGK